MLKKIQQYLLLNYPLLWNIKIVPTLLGAIVLNILFFGSGYFFTKIDFTDRYNHPDSDLVSLIFGAVLIAVLSFIIWLVFYSKNNAFKSFYPQKSSHLYAEWVLSFVIILGFALFPLSIYQGSVCKVRSYVSKQEMIGAVETLNMVRILIPSSKEDYFREHPANTTLGDSDNGDIVALDSSSEDDEKIKVSENDKREYVEHPDFTQFSLLNYRRNYEFYISEKCGFTIRNTEDVKTWLKQQNKEAIGKLIDDFIALGKKHHLASNLHKDQWMKLIYNPSKYPVGDFNLIATYNYAESSSNYYSSGYSSNEYPKYYVPYDELERAYDNIKDAYVESDISIAMLTFTLCFALSLSLMVFSFRSTSGKSWLIALISIGLIQFVIGILTFIVSVTFSDGKTTAPLTYIFVLLAIFVVELLIILRKNMDGEAKGRSEIYMNHLIWFLPVAPILLVMIIYFIGYHSHYIHEYQYNYNTYNEDGVFYKVYSFIDKYSLQLFWANIGLLFVTMWFFIQCVLRKWKSLPEQ